MVLAEMLFLANWFFQRLDPLRECLDGLLLHHAAPILCQRSNHGDDSRFALNVCNMELFATSQA